MNESLMMLTVTVPIALSLLKDGVKLPYGYVVCSPVSPTPTFEFICDAPKQFGNALDVTRCLTVPEEDLQPNGMYHHYSLT